MNDSTEKKSRKGLVVLLSLIGILFLIPMLYFLIVIPRADIQRLAKGYVEIKVTKEGVVYTQTDKKPQYWVSYSDVNYVALHALVVSEDWLFYDHKGYDFEQMKKAFEDTIEKGERLRGASTISQQVAKNLYLSSERSFLRKFNELIFAIYMERHLSKQKILEVYMNIIEFGPSLYGIKPASKKYFNKIPKDLTPREGAFLAMLLPNPKKYSQSFRERKLTEYAQTTIDEILEKMVQAKYLKQEDLEKARKALFSWETGEGAIPGQEDSGKESSADGKMAPTQPAIDPNKPLQLEQHKASAKDAPRKKRTKKARKKAGDSDFQADSDLQLEENPEFDKDAIIEDTSGLDEEFSLE
ncbi:MAG: hypothetical protein COW00_10210 [Bdellovibrio sp. CG12_big_fil_rev_8_21_14_0_65_39_13]|nr:MAG: hypothetical protein COW78_01105 [Bdellovibrio sp. CG22_combo_CG10-13_8_21_14_all_39_27]PIQ59484.1 MAG: hypothetical protein COW00_10210 [Bdellovibrio sp. CG12_big_fil_rev_8_21_14_0_65_39_13]PIR33512.1 MAG: hypothetical protein COV37_16275 [Bdellovibrio sp. CG11_big_fil_rev_8_21_14_0_20_39_38]